MGMKRFSAPPALTSQSSRTTVSSDASHFSPTPSPASPRSMVSTPQHHQPYTHEDHKQLQQDHLNHHRQRQQDHRQEQQQKQEAHLKKDESCQKQHHHQKQHQHHQKHHHLYKQHPHNFQPQYRQQHPESSGKRVKTEQTFESLFDKEMHSDVTINVNSDEYVFHAHRMILVMKSDVFASMLSKLDNKPDIEITVAEGRYGAPVLHVVEDVQCSQVFSRFLYFLYSGSVWLHQDYVLPLFKLAHKYRVKSLREHCQNYILQVLAKSCKSSSPSNQHSNNNNISHNHSLSSIPLTSPNSQSPPYMGNGFDLEIVCDLCENEIFAGDIQQTAYRLLCCQFRQMVRTERWLQCSVKTVCSLISGDNCNAEENLILVSATDYMKRNNLSEKKQIEDILSLIRYPRLDRRVLYQLQKNGSFKNFPRIQELMINAMMYHSFRDLQEAKDDFVGSQFRPRMNNNVSPNRRASMQVATVADSFPDETLFMDSAYSLDPATPITLAHTRQSQV